MDMIPLYKAATLLVFALVMMLFNLKSGGSIMRPLTFYAMVVSLFLATYFVGVAVFS